LGTPPQEFMTQLNSSVVEGHFRDMSHEPGISFDQLFPDEAFLPNASTIPNINSKCYFSSLQFIVLLNVCIILRSL